MKDRDLVRRILVNVPETRADDNLLIAHFMRIKYKETDLFRLAEILRRKNVFESCRRNRQKIQETDPTLRPEGEVLRARDLKEQEVREEMRWL